MIKMFMKNYHSKKLTKKQAGRYLRPAGFFAIGTASMLKGKSPAAIPLAMTFGLFTVASLLAYKNRKTNYYTEYFGWHFLFRTSSNGRKNGE